MRRLEFGGKGNSLRVLIAHGFDVPATFCLLSHAYDCFLERNHLKSRIEEVLADLSLNDEHRSAAIAHEFHSASIPEEIEEVVCTQKTFESPGSLWAVRSSSNLEDMQTSSAAGIYESFLNIAGPNEILYAVKKTWASLWSARAIAYRRKIRLDGEAVGMAVLIQQMVNAVYSGVLFTTDPLGKSDNRLIVEYCEGLGDRLVSGAISPFVVAMDRYGDGVRHKLAPANSMIGDIDWLALRDIALLARNRLGAELDIEWAWDGHTFKLLQARPVTILASSPKPAHVSELWTRANIGEVLPGPVTPLTWRIFLATLINRPQTAFEPAGEKPMEEGLGLRLIYGRAYIRFDRFLDSFCYLPFVTPEVMHKVLGAPLHESVQSYRPPGGMAVLAARLIFWMSILGVYDRIGRLAKTLAPRPSPGSTSLEEIIGWSSTCFRIHLKATYYAVGAFAFLTRLMTGPDSTGRIDCMTAFNAEGGYQSADQGIKIAELADVVRKYPALGDFLLERRKAGSNLDDVPVDMPGGREFSELFHRFITRNGARAAGEFELATPRWREDHSFVIDAILSMVRSQDGPKPGIGLPVDEMKSKKTPIVRNIVFPGAVSQTGFSCLPESCTAQREPQISTHGRICGPEDADIGKGGAVCQGRFAEVR